MSIEPASYKFSLQQFHKSLACIRQHPSFAQFDMHDQHSGYPCYKERYINWPMNYTKKILNIAWQGQKKLKQQERDSCLIENDRKVCETSETRWSWKVLWVV
jgi:hypothetical protein